MFHFQFRYICKGFHLMIEDNMRLGTYTLLLLSGLLLISCDIDSLINSNDSTIGLVPETAIAGIYLDDIPSFSSTLEDNSVVAEQLHLLFSNTDGTNFHPDSIGHWNTALYDVALSWHSVSGEDIGLLVLLRFDQDWELDKVKDQLSNFLDLNGQFENKLFNDQLIWQAQNEDQRWSFLYKDGFLAVSTAEILIEDVVRAWADERFKLFSEQNRAKLSGNKAFLNGARIDELSSKFFKADASRGFVNDLILLDFELQDDQISFSGTVANAQSTPGKNQLLFGTSFIPLEANHLTWKDIGEVAVNGVRPFLAEITLEVFDQNELLFILPVNEYEALKSRLDKEAEKSRLPGDSVIYAEDYASEVIGYVSGDFFNQLVSGKEADLVDGVYYSLTQNVLLFSSNDEVIRRSLAAHFDENTYGQSVGKRNFINALIQDSYYTRIIDAGNLFYDEEVLQPNYGEWVQEYLSSMRTSTVQLNATAQGYLMTGNVSFEQGTDKTSMPTEQRDNKVIANAFLEYEAATETFILKNHNNGQNELLLQDEFDQLYQLDLQGNINWKIALEDHVLTDILQVDYYNNRKLQYLILTDSLIHIIDRNGREIEGFPKPHGISSEIKGLSLVDYDNTKRYRYLISAGRGELYLYDKEVNLLKGWDPKQIDANLKMTPYHERVSGKDFFVVKESTDNIHLLNRRGEEYPGFPVSLNQRFSGDQFLKKSPSMGTTSITVISDDGLLKSINLLGKEIRSKQFLKLNSEDTYRLVSDVLGAGFVLFKTELNNTKVLNENEELICTIPRLSSDTHIKYYRLSGGRSVILTWNSISKEVVVYDLDGRIIVDQINADFLPALLFFSRTGNYQLFANFGNEVKVYQFATMNQ